MGQLILVEGLIGAGKTTFSRKLGAALNSRVMEEPVVENPYLAKFYADPKRWALEMQFWLMSKRFAMHQEAIEHIWRTGQSVIMDRSIYGDTVFAQQNFDDGNIDELGFQSYIQMRDVMLRFLMTPHTTIYLDAAPRVCLDRITMRNRGFESGIPEAYLAGLDVHYKELLKDLQKRGSRILLLDWNTFMDTDAFLAAHGSQHFPESTRFREYPGIMARPSEEHPHPQG